MTPIQKLSNFLKEIIAQENDKPVSILAGYIVGELIGDYENIYDELIKNNSDVERIGDLASDLEWSNGSSEELNQMWQELKILANRLT